MRVLNSNPAQSIAAVAMALAFSQAAVAQGLPSVGIYFEVTSTQVESSWLTADRPRIKAAIRAALATQAQRAFIFWQFAEVDTADVPVALHFLVTEPMRGGVINSAVELWKGDRQIGTTWDQPLVLPADAILRPLPSGDEIAQAFAGLLKARKTEIEALLRQQVPIAAGGQWLPPSDQNQKLRVVLPLPWDKYQRLRESLFQLACATETDESAILESTGGGRATYPSASGGQPYPALAVILKRRIYPDQGTIDPALYPALMKLSLRYVFLAEYTEPRLWDIASPAGGMP